MNLLFPSRPMTNMAMQATFWIPNLYKKEQQAPRIGISGTSTNRSHQSTPTTKIVCRWRRFVAWEPVRVSKKKVDIRFRPRDTAGENSRKQKRILCLMYTHEPMHSQARAAALTWGRRCDGFLGFSNVTTSNLGLLRLDHVGPETYGNMHQKVRSIWDHNHYGLALKRNLLSQGRNIIRERSVHVGKK